MYWKEIAMLITVGTGIGGSEARDSLAHGILFSIKNHRPRKIIFFGYRNNSNIFLYLLIFL